MKKRRKTLRQISYEYVQGFKGFVSSFKIERMAEGYGYKGSTASRRCRELCNDGMLERKLVITGNVKIVWYKAL